MKKIHLFIIVLIVAVSWGCEMEPDEFDNPTISVTVIYGSKNEPISSGTIIEDQKGTMVGFVIVYNMGADQLTNVQLLSKIGNRSQTVALDSTLNEGLFNKGAKEPVRFRYDTNIGNDDEVLTVKATDRKDRETRFSITIKALPPEQHEPNPNDPNNPPNPNDPPDTDKIYVYTLSPVTQFGGQSHTTMGSFYSVSDGKIYTIRAASQSSDYIDFVYYVNTAANGGATIYSPAQAATENLRYSSTATLNPASWSTKNQTRFTPVLGVNATADPNTWFKEWWEETMDTLDSADSKLKTGTLVNNSVYAFRTRTNEYGAFIVTANPGNADGTLSVRFVNVIEINK